MTSEKQQILKRLLLYIVLAFAPLAIAVIVLNLSMDGMLFDDAHAASPVTELVGFLGMMSPAAASILTRIVTKEGFHDSYLRANFKGNLRYYAFALLIPLAYGLCSALVVGAVYGFADNSGISKVSIFSTVTMQLEVSVMLAFYGFGEELGWRGYMMPKLEKLIGMPGAILVGGILWGLWHAPLTCSGHNFGTGYAGFPWAGIGLMCVFGTLMGCVLTFVTQKTKSVYPAAILHMVNNNVAGSLQAFLVSPEAKAIPSLALALLPIGAFAAVAFVLLLRSGNHKAALRHAA